MLAEVSKNLSPGIEAPVSDAVRRATEKEIRLRTEQAENLIAGIPNMMQLQDELRYWRGLADEYSRHQKLLTTHATAIESKMRVLDAEQDRWQATSDQVRGTPGLEVVAQRVTQELDAIQKLRSQAREQLGLILTVQDQISEQDREISSVVLKLEEAREQLRGSLLARDSFPLWTARELRIFDQPISTLVYVSAVRGFTGTSSFLRSKKGHLAGIVAAYVFSLLIAFSFKRYVSGEDKPRVRAEASQIFSRPYSIALLTALITTIGSTRSAPTGVSFVLSLSYLVPVLRLLPPLIDAPLRKLLYAISVFYILQWGHVVLQFGPVFKRELFAVMILAALVTFAWLARPSHLKIEPTSGWKRKLLVLGIRLGLLLLSASLFANVFGFVSLSQILGVGLLFSGFTFALFYTMTMVLDLGLVVVLSSMWFQSLPQARSEVVERWGRRILMIAGALLWLNVNLYLFTVHDNVVGAIKVAFAYPLGFGKIHVTLGGTLSLLFFLLLGYAVANFASFLLEELLLPKLSLKGGLAHAISRASYYVLLVILFFAAITDSGVELNKFTVITGALGLGVGFGLQNIVNNFASGLIILFERPFRVGDTVEVCGVVGIVRRIGARSTTLLTFQYAEVILPNSNLLSNEVTNWTLTSARRRVEVPVGIAYGTDPELALKLLIEVAESNPRILKDPRPEAFFLGFGESALNLELRFWAAQPIWFELKSEIGLGVLRALQAAGIEIPFPQRDLHVRSMDAVVNSEAPKNDGIAAVPNVGSSRGVTAAR